MQEKRGLMKLYHPVWRDIKILNGAEGRNRTGTEQSSEEF